MQKAGEKSDLVWKLKTANEQKEKQIVELGLKIKHITKHLEPQAMSALFEQVEEEVKREQRIEELEAIVRNTKAIDESFALQTIQLTKAKELLNMFLRLHYNPIVDEHTLFCKVEQFLKEDMTKR